MLQAPRAAAGATMARGTESSPNNNLERRPDCDLTMFPRGAEASAHALELSAWIKNRALLFGRFERSCSSGRSFFLGPRRQSIRQWERPFGILNPISIRVFLVASCTLVIESESIDGCYSDCKVTQYESCLDKLTKALRTFEGAPNAISISDEIFSKSMYP